MISFISQLKNWKLPAWWLFKEQFSLITFCWNINYPFYISTLFIFFLVAGEHPSSLQSNTALCITPMSSIFILVSLYFVIVSQCSLCNVKVFNLIRWNWGDGLIKSSHFQAQNSSEEKVYAHDFKVESIKRTT
jgi:predicted membrane metal-binding protein